jgi:hypothetical protein
VADGQLTLNELSIFETNLVPTIAPGISSAIGSIAMLDGGARKWQKFGPSDTDWKEDNVALNTSFDNSTNGFAAVNVQKAIEEAKQNAEGFPRAGLPLTVNGTVTTGSWITYSELLSNPRILFPVSIRLKEITWVNSNINLGAFTFQVYKNGQAAGNLVFTYTAPAGDRTAGYGYYVWASNLDFAAGDSMYIKYVKPSGTSLADLALIVWIARLP